MLPCRTGVIFRVFFRHARGGRGARDSAAGDSAENCFFIIIFLRFSLSRLFRVPRPLKREKKAPVLHATVVLTEETKRKLRKYKRIFVYHCS